MKLKVKICPNEEESWETSWNWYWFTREQWISNCWKENQKGLKPLFSLLPQLKVKSILDCSCGLGLKTILFARRGFEVEGSDASAVAIKYAPQLAKEEGLKIRFFRSRYDELNKKCERKYDCLFSDNFDEIESLNTLRESAKGIFSVLNKGGCFIICGARPEWSQSDLNGIIEREWKKRERFYIQPPYEKEGVKVTSIEVVDKTSEGILENRIFLIEEGGIMRAEIAFIMNPRIKWKFKDYVEVLKEAGFSKVEYIEKEGQIYNIGIK